MSIGDIVLDSGVSAVANFQIMRTRSPETRKLNNLLSQARDIASQSDGRIRNARFYAILQQARACLAGYQGMAREDFAHQLGELEERARKQDMYLVDKYA